MQARTRFAPSPTGLLHIGNAYSALRCQAWAAAHDAELLLRIEDIDFTRCQPHFSDAIYEDLHWLGLSWQEPVRLQSQHRDAYRDALDHLRQLGVLYPCFCTRKQIQQEMINIGLAPHHDDSTAIYPGRCRHLPAAEQQQRMQHEAFAWRLDIAKALRRINKPLQWRDDQEQMHAARLDHDVVIGRKDIAFSYHLAVVVDDAIQRITHVIRGEDLMPSTGIHCLLQQLLDLPQPVYLHHPLLNNNRGQRLAKRTHATTLQSLRHMAVNPATLRHYLSHETPPIWPFSDQDTAELLSILGNTP